MPTTPKTRREYKGGASSTTLNGAFSAGATTATITANTGWPTTGPFYAVVDPGTSSEEKIYVGSISSTSLSSITRGVDGTSDVNHSDGAIIYPVFTAIDADEANQLTATYANQGGMVYLGDPSFTQLAIGTAGQVLKVNSGATAPEWGQVAAAGIASSAVETAKINDSAVTTAKIADDAVTQAKIGAGAVGTTELVDASVTSAKLAAPTLTAKTDSFTLALVDANCTMQCNKATAMTLTVPTNSIDFADGTVITVVQYGAGQVTVAGASGVDVRSGNGLKLRTQYSAATLIKISDTEWILSGDTVS